jgi:protein-arginine kinase activator protein McsA
MKEAAAHLAFEEAAVLRDRIRELENQRFEIMTLS